jgi:23S rRNA (adenine2503-C2)-methyltransferase
VDNRLSFFNFTREELAAFFESLGEPRFRADQVFLNVYQRRTLDFMEMTDLPKPLRQELESRLDLRGPVEAARRRSPSQDAVKLLWRLEDGHHVESVLMKADYGETLCFSTQVGCAFRCSFCVTGKMGRLRNLSSGEIVAQIYLHLAESLSSKGPNLVAMGMGEPMDNLDALLKAIETLQDPKGLNIAGRRMTVSTVGVVPGILRLGRENPSVALALSLNATTNEVRSELMPVTRKYPIEVLIPAVETYARASKRRVTLEYVLIKGLNDTRGDAERLGRIAERFPSKVNVIPFNPSDLFAYERPDPERVDAFAKWLWPYRTTVTVRYSKGLDIQAACGQLGYDQVKSRLAAGA